MNPMKQIITALCATVIANTVLAQALPKKPDAAQRESSLTATAATAPVDKDKFVTREEYDALLKRLIQVEAKLSASEKKTETRQTEVDESLDDLEKQVKTTKSLATTAQPGNTKFLLTGYGSAGYEDRRGKNSTFTGSFNPIFLWHLNERVFFESELELEFDGNAATVNLEYANLSYLLNNYVTIKAGKFLSPFGIYADRLHAAWINKLPDAPLPFGHTGIAPFSELGVQVSGGFKLGPTKWHYALYASNGPRLNLGTDEPDEAGVLHFDNNTDLNNSKAVGGRIGFLPIPQLELGYSVQTGKVAADRNIRATLQALDLSYVQDADWLNGTFDVRGEWVWSDVGRTTFDAGGELGFGPLTFNNKRNGGYVQLAYRPSKVKQEVLKNFELVGRWAANKSWYKQRVVIPVSVVIGLVAAYWTVERVFFA